MSNRPNIHRVFAWIFLAMVIANIFGPTNWYSAAISWLSVGLTILEFSLADKLDKERFRERFKR